MSNEKWLEHFKNKVYEFYINKPKSFFRTVYNTLVTNNDDKHKIMIRAMYVEIFKELLVRDGHKWSEIDRQKLLRVLNALNNPDYYFRCDDKFSERMSLIYKSPLIFEYKGKEYVYEVMSRSEFEKLDNMYDEEME